MESFERCLAERPGLNANIAGEISAPALVESYAKAIESCNLLDPKALLLPQPYVPQSLLEWVGAYDLMNREEVFVSANAVYHPYDCTRPVPETFPEQYQWAGIRKRD